MYQNIDKTFVKALGLNTYYPFSFRKNSVENVDIKGCKIFLRNRLSRFYTNKKGAQEGVSLSKWKKNQCAAIELLSKTQFLFQL